MDLNILLLLVKMSGDEVWYNKEACEAYVNEQEKVTMVRSKDREMMLEVLSHYLPDEDKVHVGLGIGGGLDFKLTNNIPHVVRRIGVDYSPTMLKLCKEKHPNTELIKDDLLHLKKLKKVLKKEDKPVFLTLMTNTLGNFSSEDRSRVVRSIRKLMKDNDLLVAELYKRPELISIDPGLPPDRYLKTKVRIIDFKKRKISEPIPLLKVPPYRDFMKNPQLSWFLHSMAQQEHYGDLKIFQKVMGKIGHSAYWPETGDMVIYKLLKGKPGDTQIYGVTVKSKREEFEKYFEPVITSHRWEGIEMAKTFMDAGLCGYAINGEDSFILFFIPNYLGKEKLGEFRNRYNGLFK